MRQLRAAFRFSLFVCATFALYGLLLAGKLVLPNKRYWRQLVFRWWTSAFVWITRMKIVVEGTIPKPPFFLVTNHLGYTDIAALRATVEGVFVAKAEVEKWPVAGRMVRDMCVVFIDRAKRTDIPRAGEQVLERLENGEGVIVFPEGTSTEGADVLPFNSSFFEFAARGGVAVSYAALMYEVPKGETPASDAVCWGRDVSFLAHLWQLLQLREYTAIIRFGDEPISNSDRKALAAELQTRVTDLFTPIE